MVVNKELAQEEVDALITKGTNETVEVKYARLAREYEELGDLETSKKYVELRAKANPRSIDLWRDSARSSISTGEDVSISCEHM